MMALCKRKGIITFSPWSRFFLRVLAHVTFGNSKNLEFRTNFFNENLSVDLFLWYMDPLPVTSHPPLAQGTKEPKIVECYL